MQQSPDRNPDRNRAETAPSNPYQASAVDRIARSEDAQSRNWQGTYGGIVLCTAFLVGSFIVIWHGWQTLARNRETFECAHRARIAKFLRINLYVLDSFRSMEKDNTRNVESSWEGVLARLTSQTYPEVKSYCRQVDEDVIILSAEDAEYSGVRLWVLLPNNDSQRDAYLALAAVQTTVARRTRRELVAFTPDDPSRMVVALWQDESDLSRIVHSAIKAMRPNGSSMLSGDSWATYYSVSGSRVEGPRRIHCGAPVPRVR